MVKRAPCRAPPASCLRPVPVRPAGRTCPRRRRRVRRLESRNGRWGALGRISDLLHVLGVGEGKTWGMHAVTLWKGRSLGLCFILQLNLMESLPSSSAVVLLWDTFTSWWNEFLFHFLLLVSLLRVLKETVKLALQESQDLASRKYLSLTELVTWNDHVVSKNMFC